MKTTVTGAGLLAGALLLGGGAAQATLVDYTSSGVNLVYDQDRNLTSGQVAAAPLPATGLLVAVGLMALGATRRARRATLVIR